MPVSTESNRRHTRPACHAAGRDPDLADELALAVEVEGRDGADVGLAGGLLVGVHVHLQEGDLGVLGAERGVDGGDGAAGGAPGGREVRDGPLRLCRLVRERLYDSTSIESVGFEASADG